MDLRIPQIKLMSSQEFQRVHWKHLREQGGVEDCSRLGYIKIDMGMRVHVMRDDLQFLE